MERTFAQKWRGCAKNRSAARITRRPELGFQSFNEGRQIHAARWTDCAQFDDIQSPLARFVLADFRLADSETLREIGLLEAGRHPHFADKIRNDLMLSRERHGGILELAKLLAIPSVTATCSYSKKEYDSGIPFPTPVQPTIQLGLLDSPEVKTQHSPVQPFTLQLLKWIGNKQRFAHEIVGYFPADYGMYYEPFVGSGAVLGTLMPRHAVASDVIEPLISLWRAVAGDPDQVKKWYAERWHRFQDGHRVEVFEEIKASYNAKPNAADFLFITRSCYGGVMRFRKDGDISTPVGIHNPVSPDSFNNRVNVWHHRVHHADFRLADFEEVMASAKPGDVVYCDPPYTHTQAILYGAQSFDLRRLFNAIASCKDRGVNVLLSIDGSKRSGDLLCDVRIPAGLFEEEAFVNCGRSMLRRFQMRGESLEREIVRDRLLLTF